jgi:DNA-binding XRE family transcriptional regulator
MSLIRLLVQKLRWTTSFAETIAQFNTPGRLLLILLHYKDILGKEIASGKRYEIKLFMNQTDLASLVGARRNRMDIYEQEQWQYPQLRTAIPINGINIAGHEATFCLPGPVSVPPLPANCKMPYPLGGKRGSFSGNGYS